MSSTKVQKFKLKELENENIDKKKISVYKIKVRQYSKILSVLKDVCQFINLKDLINEC